MTEHRAIYRAAPLVVSLALIGAVLAAAGGTGHPGAGSPLATFTPSASPPPLRSNPNILPFQGLGTWIDLYDKAAWADPKGTVDLMAAGGVRTLFLETSNYNRDKPFVYKGQVSQFVDAAHADGLRIVSWYLPGLANIHVDFARAISAIRLKTHAGNSFDGFGLDIEAAVVRSPSARTQALLTLSSELRSAAGETYPLGAIVPLPQRLVAPQSYWPGFPFADLASIYDAILPMTYFTFQVSGCQAVHGYVARSIETLRQTVGSDQVPIHVIGGIAQSSTTGETRCFVDAVRERGVIGGSDYTFLGVTSSMTSALQRIPGNPVESPPQPLRPGPTAVGNVPGVDATHPREAVYRVSGAPGAWTLSFDGYDIGAGEVSVYVDWRLVATLQAGPKAAWSGDRTLTIADTLMDDSGANFVAFVASGDAPTWGVRNVSVTRG